MNISTRKLLKKARSIIFLLSFSFQAVSAVEEYQLPDSVPVQSGTMLISAGFEGGLFRIEGLTSGVNLYNWLSARFTVDNAGAYLIGTSESPFDTVVVLYEGIFDSTNPSNGVLALNDDFTIPFPAGLSGSLVCVYSGFVPVFKQNSPLTQPIRY